MQHQIKKNLGVTRHGQHTEFRVWAPFAKKVELTGTVCEAKNLAMKSERDGYWSLRLKNVEPGQNYVYLITTAEDTVLTRNDPRAQQLTTSDSGASALGPDRSTCCAEAHGSGGTLTRPARTCREVPPFGLWSSECLTGE